MITSDIISLQYCEYFWVHSLNIYGPRSIHLHSYLEPLSVYSCTQKLWFPMTPSPLPTCPPVRNVCFVDGHPSVVCFVLPVLCCGACGQSGRRGTGNTCKWISPECGTCCFSSGSWQHCHLNVGISFCRQQWHQYQKAKAEAAAEAVERNRSRARTEARAVL